MPVITHFSFRILFLSLTRNVFTQAWETMQQMCCVTSQTKPNQTNPIELSERYSTIWTVGIVMCWYFGLYAHVLMAILYGLVDERTSVVVFVQIYRCSFKNLCLHIDQNESEMQWKLINFATYFS